MPASPGRGPNDPPHVNHTHPFLPGGRQAVHDKLCLTPDEMDPAGRSLNASSRVPILICLDIEMPALAASLAQHAPDIDLLIVPLMTEKRSGYHCVFDCARARAV